MSKKRPSQPGDTAESASSSGTGAHIEGAPEVPLPVVGIGASAGGLEVFRRFIRAMPADSGMAFVLIPHLDPTHESQMAELLAKHTPMPVREARDGLALRPNQVYIIPPGKYLSISAETLWLETPTEPRGQRMAIDHFFRALAVASGEAAIGIVLSGTGAHGTLGLREIKGHGGLTLVQEPATADYAQMPRNAIAGGQVDYILPLEEMPEVLMQYAGHARTTGIRRTAPTVERESDQLGRILILLQSRGHYDFHCYRKNMLMRRVCRRMHLCHVHRLADYLERLRGDAQEVELLLKDFLIGVTRFFREPEAFDALRQRLLDVLEARKESDIPIRVWVPGCATGEEAYSVAMLLVESFSRLRLPCRMQLFATDLDQEALAFARQGVYPESIAGDLSADRLARFFVKVGNHHYQVNKQLREAVVFAAQNLVGDAPFSRLDLISCRNLLIYLESEVQGKIIRLFHFALNPGGTLFLGPSETLGRQLDLFEALSRKWRLFRRIGGTRRDMVEFPIAEPGARHGALPMPTQGAPEPDLDFAGLTQRLLLEAYAPASVLVNQHCEILYFYGPTVRYLEFPTGAPTMDLIAMARPGLRTKLRATCFKAVREKQRISIGDARVERQGGHFPVNLTVSPVSAPTDARGLLLVTFSERREEAAEAARPAAGERQESALVRQLEYELNSTREDLQGIIEELKASNEEIMSMNEELQSSNEELETSKEEFQSLNEELTTVNTQLQDKVDELERSNNDITNLLGSTDIATLFLDTELRIKRFTPALNQLLPLLATDIGRPFSHFSLKLHDSALLDDAKRVLQALTPLEQEVSTPDERHYLRRIQPYRTEDNRIEGVVVTFVNITERVAAAAESRRLAALLRGSNDAVVVFDLNGRIDDWNQGAARIFGYTVAEAQRMSMSTLVPEEEKARFAAMLRRIAKGENIAAYEARRVTKAGRVLDVWVSITTVLDEQGKCAAIASTERDITHRKQIENELKTLNRELEQRVQERTAELQRSEQEFRTLADNVPAMFAYVDAAQRYRYVNRRYAELFAEPAADLLGRPVKDILGPASYERVRPHIDVVLSGREERFEVSIDAPGARCDFQTTLVPDSDPDGRIKGYFVLANDISERKRMERALYDKSKRLSAIVDTAADAIITVDGQGNVQDFNRAAEGMFGLRAEQAIGLHIRRLLVVGNGEAMELPGAGDARSREMPASSLPQELAGRRRDGGTFPMELSVSAVDHLGLYVCLLRDISHRKALEREVIEMSTLEQERIGREIHDGIGQQLTAVGMLANSLERRLEQAERPREARFAAELVGHLQRTLQEAKALSRGLSPVQIGPDGLTDALSLLVERAQAASTVRCRLSVPDRVGALDEFTAVHLYRIVQEALNNAVKHARAENIDVCMQGSDGGLRLSVRDDGIGIKPTADRKGRLGQHIMRYRAGIIGAELVIKPAAGGGTLVECRLPEQSLMVAPRGGLSRDATAPP